MITQKIKTMMREVDIHITKKERLKAMSKIEEIGRASCRERV